jgi:hypothetical protein
MHDFSLATIKRLAKKGIHVRGTVAVPNYASDMPWACADRGYSVDDNGCGKVWTFGQVLEAAGLEPVA